MKIFFIGMPGSGKSTIGRKMAEALGLSFIDLDEYIEISSCKYIDEIFNDYGEKFFRDLETNCLKELMDRDDCIVSCGGGIVIKPQNKQYMNGDIIYLEASLETITKRILLSEVERPLLKTKSLVELYNERNVLYDSFATKKYVNDDLGATVTEIVKEYRR